MHGRDVANEDGVTLFVYNKGISGEYIERRLKNS